MAAARPRRKAVTTEALRKDLAGRLPGRLRALLADYDTFAAAPTPPEEPKAYAAHHGACKAALQHADMLVKLLRWAEGGGPEDAGREGGGGEGGGGEVARLLARARRAVADDDDGEGDDDGL